MQQLREIELLHPRIRRCIHEINKEVINRHSAPFRLFECARTTSRQAQLVEKGRQKTLVSRLIYNMDSDPPVYSTAFHYVYFTADTGWSWNIRSATISAWYHLFAQLVLDQCPMLDWGGYMRDNVDFSYFELRSSLLGATE